jgi:RimJ/RimL family protein N-acetyltransferase
MRIEFRRLGEVDPSEYVALHANPLVRRQMPLMEDDFDLDACQEWIKGKERMWEEHGFGPWAFLIDGRFAGWGGLQPEEGDADLGLVLHPDYWGKGKAIYEEIIRRAFGEMGFESVTILLPPTRTRVKGILRLGFKPDGETVIADERFIRYRLYAQNIEK